MPDHQPVGCRAATIVDHNGALEVTGVNDAGTNTFRGWVASTTVNSVGMCVEYQPSTVPTSGAFSIIGVFMRESATAKAISADIFIDHAGNKLGIEVSTWSNNTTRVVAGQPYGGIDPNGPVFIRLRKSGTNILTEITRWNPNDTTATGWSTIRTDTVASIFTTGPDQEGIMTMGIQVAPHGYVLHFLNS